MAARNGPTLVASASAVLLLAAVGWWLAVDCQVPDFDSGKHLLSSWSYADSLRAWDLSEPFTAFTQYPPQLHVVGAIGTLVAGVHVAPAVLAVGLAFIPLLALGLYRAGALVGDRWTGALAVVFAIGTPMVVTEFRAYMLEPVMTALLALAAWLVLASDRFERVGLAAGSGVAVGLGLLTKQTFAFFVAGLVAMVVLRGGWRNPRGLLALVLPALLIAVPWYAVHWAELRAPAIGRAAATPRARSGRARTSAGTRGARSTCTTCFP